MRNLLLALTALTLTSVGACFAQDACTAANTSSSSTLPESAGCIPATFKPADGGPARPVLLPIMFTNVQGGAVPVPPTAMKLREFQIGALGTYVEPDYGHSVNVNVGVFAAYTANHIGVEAEGSSTVVSRNGIHEDTALAGPRFQVRYKTVTFYAKAQVGAGRFSGDPGNRASNKTIALMEQYGGGMDLRVLSHVKVRVADFSYQKWTQFSPNTLSPYHASSGVSFTF